MAASERVKRFSSIFRNDRQWQVLVIGWILVCLLFPATVKAQIDCYYCAKECDSVIADQITPCGDECGIWYSTADDTVQVGRGCIESFPGTAVEYQRCTENICNDAIPKRCLQCASVDSSECQEVLCSGTEDECYLNPADGHRGCTSDQNYETDCWPEAGNDRCSLCSSPVGRSCNENIRCVVCDESAGEQCLQEPDATVQSCPSSSDQCYRYLDADRMLHMGCTSSEDYRSNCGESDNCHTCTTDECNRDAIFTCNSCSGCPTLDKDLFTPVECTIAETDQCYVGYDWMERETVRGCTSPEALELDAVELCDVPGCNDADFPTHLQCYQCVGCDQIASNDVNFCQSVSATGCFMLLTEPEEGLRTLIRGCNTDEAYSECREDQNCVTCSGDACNGGPKTGRIFCARCSGVDECELNSEPPSCADNFFYNRCYMYSDVDGTLMKGCLLELEPGSELATVCYDPADSRCQYCTGYSCNRQHCISCDTRTDGLDCILGLASGKLRYEMCASNSDVCRTVVDVEGHTVRGCVDQSIDPCDSTVACSDTVTPGSNKDVFPPERLRCYKCNGEEWCGEEQDEGTAQYCTLYYGTDDGCYTYQDGTTVVRGCTADPNARCKTDEDPFCKVASESLSNGEFQNMISCYQDCPGGTGSELCTPAVACIPPNDRCFLSVSTTGVISRGCTTAFQGCPLDSRDCYVCVESNCNGAFGVCANCDTELGEDCTVPEEHGKVCQNGMASCFHYVDREKEIYGCAEPVPEFCEDDADHCQICTGALCNLKALTVCLSCTGCEDVDGNVEPDSQICADGDTCFTGLVGTRVDRGCRSAMPDPIEMYQQLESCSSPMFCNDLSRADWVSCYVCSDCPDVPPDGSSQLCQNPLSNRCFTLRDGAGQVHRGCVDSALPEGCVEGLNCAICTGEDYCNDQTASGSPTPESPAFSCVRCQGETCSEYNAISACPNEVGLLFEGCVTYDAGDGSVRKGCLSESALWELCSADPTSCKVSDVQNGNARQIRCFTCERLMECIEKQEQQESSLVVYDSGACVVFFDSVQETPTGLVAYDIVRGNSNEGCANKNPELCFECYTDGCNGELFPRDRLQCVQCRGEECAQLSTSESIPLKPCRTYSATNAQCFTRFEGELFAERGCQGDTTVCLDPDDTKCRLCEGNGCNDLEYGLLYESVTCQTCSGNAQCETDPTVTTCSDKTRGCYSYFSGPFVVAKGCVSDITPTSSFYDDCTVVGGTERCQRCGGDNCNSHLCFECDSNEDEDCFEPRVGQVHTVSCPSPECIAFVDSSAHIIRGCSSNYETPYACSAQLETCLQCEGDYCNAGPIPRNRIKCHQCAGNGVDCLSPAIGDAKYCPIYNYEEERCYTYFADENTVRRGCVTEENPECNEEYCKQCNTSACNDQRPLIPNTLRCVQCDSVESCRVMENIGPQPCLGYHLFGRPEQCYTVFDESNAVSRRGCLSQLPETEANRCRNGADFNCKACSSDGCNAQSVECVVCDSNTNPACGGNALSGSFERNRCGTGRCVSLVKDWITWKGCWEDFEAECAAPENAGIKCAIFEGNLSNTGIFPEDRLKCYHCEGPRDTCGQIGSGTTLEVCQRYHPLDECYTYVSDSGYTIRGCSTTVAQECNENTPAHCPRCQGDGCNSEPFEQPNWLTCAKCAHATECAERQDNPVFELCTRKLLLGRHDDCYTYSFGGEVLERGCLSEADPTIQAQCVDGSSECSVCHCDRCNGPPTSCVVCQGERGCGDAGNTDLLQSCTTGTCVITSFVWNSDGVLMIAKQCSETVQLDTCSKGPPGVDYQVCHSPGCNDVLYPPGRIRCYQCEGAGCADPSLLPTVCDPYIEGMNACYSFFDRQQKGCIGQLNQTQRDECQIEGTVCRTCSSGDGCNLEPRPQECTVCSSESDPDCGSRQIGSTARTRKSCSTGGCATYIDDNGFTVKGCAVDFQLTEASCSDENDALCYVCSTGDGCNDELLFPPDRQECFQCSGAACVDVTLNSPTTCRRYNASTDGCYTYAIDRDNIERGCLNERPSCAEEAACVTCTSPNTGCNTEPAIVPNGHSCYQCDGVDCAPKRTGPGTACSGELLLGRTDSCYTFVDTYTVRRGCYSDEDACDPANPSCHVCALEKDCNADEYTVTSNQCIQCFEGTDGEACLWGYSSSEATRCTEPESSPSSSRTGCYRCYDNEDEAADYPLFRRGCVGDAGEQRCHNDSGYSVCLGAGCNNRNERIQICAKCGTDDGCDRWIVEECRGTVPYERRGCYVMRDVRKRILGRGCVAQLNESDWERCQDVRDGSCTMCFGNQCNGATTAMLGGHLTGLLAGTVVLTIRLLVSFSG